MLVIVVVMIILILISNNNEIWYKRKCIGFFMNQKLSVQAEKTLNFALSLQYVKIKPSSYQIPIQALLFFLTKRNFQRIVEIFNRIKIENR